MQSLNQNELVYRQAVRMAALIHKMREKEPLQAAEQQELADWLKASESNTQLSVSLQNREQLTSELEVLMQYDEDNAVATIFNALGEQPPAAATRERLIVKRLLIAACMLLLIGVASWFFIRKPGIIPDTLSKTYKTITTRPGEQQRVALADGSEVWLNAVSSISYPVSFKGNTREVTITGEAYFSVAPLRLPSGHKVPFIVKANNMKVEVLGTRFDVMAYSDENDTRVTLLEGSVRVGRQQTADGRQESVILKPGEQAVITASHSPLTIDHSPDLEHVNAWRNGAFNFKEASVPEVMRQVARWYDVKIAYRGAVDTIHFSGQISRKEKMKELLEILSDTRRVHFEIKDDTTLVVIPGHK